MNQLFIFRLDKNLAYCRAQMMARYKPVFLAGGEIFTCAAIYKPVFLAAIENNRFSLSLLYVKPKILGYVDEKGTSSNEDVPLCGRRESNPYASRHQILSLACLPISTRPRIGLQMYDKLSDLQI